MPNVLTLRPVHHRMSSLSALLRIISGNTSFAVFTCHLSKSDVQFVLATKKTIPAARTGKASQLSRANLPVLFLGDELLRLPVLFLGDEFVEVQLQFYLLLDALLFDGVPAPFLRLAQRARNVVSEVHLLLLR